MTAQAYVSDGQQDSNLILADNESMVSALQQALSRLGESGPHDQVSSIDNAAYIAHSYRSSTKRIVVVLGSDPTIGLEAVRSVRAITPAPIYVVGPRDAGLILDAVHAGADNFIEDADPLDQHLAKALSRIRNDGKAATEGQLIYVTSARGGCGGSSISINLASAFARQLQRVALCDLDLQNGVCDARLNLKPKHSILDLEGRIDRMDRSSIESALTRHASGIHLLSAPPAVYDHRIRFGELYVCVIRLLKQMFPLVVADFPRPNVDFDAERLLSMCDKLVLVTRFDFDSLRGARRMIDRLGRSGLPSAKIHVVGNRVGQKNLLSTSHIEEALGCKVLQQFSDDIKTVNRSINCGTPFYSDSVGGPLIKELNLLVKKLAIQNDKTTSLNLKTNPTDSHANSTSGVRRFLAKWLVGQTKATLY